MLFSSNRKKTFDDVRNGQPISNLCIRRCY